VDDVRFDGLIRALGSGATRRGALGILAGFAGLGLSEVAAKKKGRGKGKGRGKRKRTGRVQAAAADKVAVCHYDADADTYVLINISQSGWDNGHSKHEQDFQRGDEGGCCNDSDCSHLDVSPCYIGVCDPTAGTCRQVFTGDGGCLS
jgi:hypothetical protein